MIETKSPALVLGLFLAASAFGQIASPPLSGPAFPPFSLTATETAYVNLINIAQPSASGPAPMCLVTLTFYTGTETGQSALASNIVKIGSGEFYSVPMPYANTGAFRAARADPGGSGHRLRGPRIQLCHRRCLYPRGLVRNIGFQRRDPHHYSWCGSASP